MFVSANQRDNDVLYIIPIAQKCSDIVYHTPDDVFTNRHKYDKYLVFLGVSGTLHIGRGKFISMAVHSSIDLSSIMSTSRIKRSTVTMHTTKESSPWTIPGASIFPV